MRIVSEGITHSAGIKSSMITSFLVLAFLSLTQGACCKLDAPEVK